jgi:hypothetical protein
MVAAWMLVAPALPDCYETMLKSNKVLTGRIELSWEVQNRHVVGEPRVVENTTGDDELARCFARKIAQQEFPATIRGVISMPIVFER